MPGDAVGGSHRPASAANAANEADSTGAPVSDADAEVADDTVVVNDAEVADDTVVVNDADMFAFAGETLSTTVLTDAAAAAAAALSFAAATVCCFDTLDDV
jgi:hypothetical protein